MSSVRLNKIKMTRESKSFTDALYAILIAADMFDGPKYMLSGLSGMAFKFTVHEQLLPLSVTAYGQWATEHGPAVDNLGVCTVSDSGRTRHPTFSYYQQDAVQWVKESLDDGVGVIYWIPEFGVIHGYDDEDRVFFLQDGRSGESQIVLYDNFGINVTPFWYCRVFMGKVDVKPEDMVLESLRLALVDWETPHKTLPNTDIASGRLAYTFLTRGLEREDYHEFGAVYILNSFIYSRTEIMNYLCESQSALGGLSDASLVFSQIEPTLNEIRECIIETKEGRRVNRQQLPRLVQLLMDALRIEEETMRHFRVISGKYPDLKRTTLPRWGAHIPR